MSLSTILRLLPSELPMTFQQLTPAEQAWRARVFLMVWILYGHEAYSWSMALAFDEAYEAETRKALLDVNDQLIIEGFGVAWDERRHW
jgi:hypothetical protein